MAIEFNCGGNLPMPQMTGYLCKLCGGNLAGHVRSDRHQLHQSSVAQLPNPDLIQAKVLELAQGPLPRNRKCYD